jgi:hypothetical protein
MDVGPAVVLVSYLPLPVAEEVEVSVDVFSRVLNASSRLDANATLCPLFRLMQVGPSLDCMPSCLRHAAEQREDAEQRKPRRH